MNYQLSNLIKYQWLIISLLLLLLVGCADSGMSDLESFVAEEKKKINPQVEPIPEFDPVESFLYPANIELKPDPFKPFVDTNKDSGNETTQGTTTCDVQPPDKNRVKVGLELIPLDALRMVGTIQAEKGDLQALVKSTDGTVYPVKRGDFMGTNFGKIINITEDEIELAELYSDGIGCWIERNTPMTAQK